jgi:hypothetical protein
MSFTGGYQSNNSGSENSINGAVFITDIQAQNAGNNVGGKVYSSGDRVLDHCVSDTPQIRVYVLAITGNTHFAPVINVEGTLVSLTQNEDQSVWTGYVDIDITGITSITATHEDGATHTTSVLADAGAEILSAVFSGGYPNAQTELKEGDTFLLSVVSDVPMTRIEISDFGAGKAQVFNFSASTNKSIDIEIEDRGNTTQMLGLRLRAMNENGSYGSEFETTSAGATNGAHIVSLNNQHPVISIGSITYPSSQSAIKDSESVIVNHSISSFDTIQYDSPTNELGVANHTVFETVKSVSRLSGDYNVSNDNFRVVATRAANDAVSTKTTTVQIAHAIPEISISLPAARLVSGGNMGTQPQSHVITTLTNQLLLSVPQISAPEGTFQEDSETNPDGLGFTRTLIINDDDNKGSFAFQLIQATNLAGRIVTAFTGSSIYVIGGFVKRTLIIPSFQREVNIGTSVSMAGKLVASDKDEAAMTYTNSFTNVALGFTISGPSSTLNTVGNLFYWNDTQAVNNNTTGLASVTIEEPP